ncbi:DgyrCDS2665 [Dimorphilus gyrociliatus]|uniref:DgyrCDS2665 n=1 Tax=Dimorphilus gyrociliatus TaxID=2664684 RepID=A0A7I8VAY8_9ANNE|nr:DgyrCDS2665 [Dimorphilus gyrociliatus]
MERNGSGTLKEGLQNSNEDLQNVPEEKTNKLTFSTSDGTQFQLALALDMDVNQAMEACQAVAQSVGKGNQAITLILDDDSPYKDHVHEETQNNSVCDSSEKVNLLVDYGNKEVVVECPVQNQEVVIALLNSGLNNFAELTKYGAIVHENKDQTKPIAGESEANAAADNLQYEFSNVANTSSEKNLRNPTEITNSATVEEIDGKKTYMTVPGMKKRIEVDGDIMSLKGNNKTKEVVLYSCPFCFELLFTAPSQLYDHVQAKHKNHPKFKNMQRSEFITRTERGSLQSGIRGPGRPRGSKTTTIQRVNSNVSYSENTTSMLSGLLYRPSPVDPIECRRVFCSPWMYYLSNEAYECGARLPDEKRNLKTLPLPNYAEIEKEIMHYDPQTDAEPEGGLDQYLEDIEKKVEKQTLTIADMEMAEHERMLKDMRKSEETTKVDNNQSWVTGYLPAKRGRPPKRKMENSEKPANESTIVLEDVTVGTGIEIQVENAPKQFKRTPRKERQEERKEIQQIVIESIPKKESKIKPINTEIRVIEVPNNP